MGAGASSEGRRRRSLVLSGKVGSWGIMRLKMAKVMRIWFFRLR
jgi:hypothetical protein